MIATPHNFMASIESKMEFENGVLKSMDSAGDATAVPKALISAAKTILPKLMGFPFDGTRDETPRIPGPSVYKVEVRGLIWSVLTQRHRGC